MSSDEFAFRPVGMRGLLCAILALFLLGSGSFGEAASGTEFKATKAAGTIVIDGQLNDPAWKNAPAWGSFSSLSATGDRRDPAPTTFKILVSDQAIYLGITCDEPAMNRLKASDTQVNSAWLFNNDCIEIFLAPQKQGNNYYHFAVSAANSHYSAYRIEGGHTTWGAYSPIWESAIHKGENSWTLEVKIPLSALYYTDSKDFSDNWRVNVTRERLTTSPRELSTWSKLKSQFHEPVHFNHVSGMPRKPSRYDLRLGLATVTLSPAGAGAFRGTIRFTTDADAEAGGKHTLTLMRDDKPWAAGEVVIAGGPGYVKLDSVPFSHEGKMAAVATLRDSGGEIVHQQRLVLYAQYAPLSIDISNPFYANCIFPDESIRQIEGTVIASLPEDSLRGARLIATLQGSDRKPLSTSRVPLNGPTASFSLDAADLPTGNYTVVCEIEKDGKSVASQSAAIRKLVKPEGGSYVYINRHLDLVVNGKPIFVRGWYGDQSYAMSTALLKKFGTMPDSKYVNAWHCQVDMEADWLDRSESGERQSRDVRPSQKVFDGMLKKIEKTRTNPKALWYYLSDEPEARGVSPVYLKYQYDFIKEHDPYHPVMIISRAPDRYIHCADILNPHPYLNPRVDSSGKRSMVRDVKSIRDEMRLVLSSGQGRIAPWLTPQAFSDEFEDIDGRYPTFTEFRCMFYTGLVNGARGFTPYAYWNHFKSLDLRWGSNFIYQTLDSIDRFLLSPRATMNLQVRTSDDGVDAWAKTVDGDTLLIAVNLLDRPMTATIRSDGLRGLSNLTGYRESTTAAVHDGAVMLQFAPYQVHLLTSRKLDGELSSVESFEKTLVEAKEKQKATGGILFGRGRQIEWDASSNGDILGDSPMNMMFSLCDGITDAYGWVAGRNGSAWLSMIFPQFTPTFRRVRIYGANIRQAQLQFWSRGDWQDGPSADWDGDSPFIDIHLPQTVRTVKLRLNFPRVKSGSPAEVYEVELFEH